MDEEPKVLKAEKVSVCPKCYEYVVCRQKFPVQDASEQLVVWHFYCLRCKEFVTPKLMDIVERQFLNVRAMRKILKPES